MALHYELPVYTACYDLLLEGFRFTKLSGVALLGSMPRITGNCALYRIFTCGTAGCAGEAPEAALASVPGIEEHSAYGMPGFKYNGHPMLYIGAAKKHCALFGSVPLGFKRRLKDFTMRKGTIRFTPVDPLPAGQITAIVKAKCAEIGAIV